MTINEFEVHQKARVANDWQTSAGQRILVSDMSIPHIKNCVHKIKQDDWRKHWLRILENELEYRDRLFITTQADEDKYMDDEINLFRGF